MKNLLGLTLQDMTPDERTAVWRWTVTLVVALFGLLAVGKVPGFGGFVLTSEFSALKSDVNDIQISLIEQDIEQAQERVCKMVAAGNREAVRYAAEKRNELIGQYRALTSEEPIVPTCDELGIGLSQPDPASMGRLLSVRLDPNRAC